LIVKRYFRRDVMFLEKVPAGVYAVNCYIIGDDKTDKAAVIAFIQEKIEKDKRIAKEMERKAKSK